MKVGVTVKSMTCKLGCYGSPVLQSVLNMEGSGNSLSRNLQMSSDSPMRLPLYSKTGTCKHRVYRYNTLTLRRSEADYA